MLGRIGALGVGPQQVVPLAFHVDYFNDPWPDPLSNHAFTERESAYGTVKDRKDLFFTPMMMVDGRTPMLGSDRSKALAAISGALKEPPGVALSLDLSSDRTDGGARAGKSLRVNLSSLSPRVYGRKLLVGAALFEDPVATNVRAGENAGKRLVDRYAVRTFLFQEARLDAEEPSASKTFSLELGPDWNASHCGVAVFVQDWKSGEVFQAGSIPWEGGPPRATRPRKRR